MSIISWFITQHNDAYGNDAEAIKLLDKHGNFMAFTIAIQVDSVNEAPTMETVSFSAIEDQTFNVTLAATGVEHYSFTFALLEDAIYDVASLTAEGELSYTPDANFMAQIN